MSAIAPTTPPIIREALIFAFLPMIKAQTGRIMARAPIKTQANMLRIFTHMGLLSSAKIMDARSTPTIWQKSKNGVTVTLAMAGMSDFALEDTL